jgi:methylamine dehydrogenase accessory protein MauD
MTTALLMANIVLGVLVLSLAFLVVGSLRALGRLSWRVEQMEVTSPRRIGRDGVQVGRVAPDFTLPSAAGEEVSLHDFAGRAVLLVFTQSGCGPCHAIMPELNRVQRRGGHQVVVVNNGTPDEARELADGARAEFPVLAQDHFDLSKRYEVFATPFAFAIGPDGTVTSKGLVGTRQHLGFVLGGAGNRETTKHHPAAERDSAVEREPAADPLTRKEVSHA